MRSGNPALNDHAFKPAKGERAMTLNGVIAKTAFLLILTVISALYVWGEVEAAYLANDTKTIAAFGDAMGWLIAGALLVAVVLGVFPWLALVLAPVYAVLKGIVIGSLATWFDLACSGIMFQAFALTAGVALAMLLAYGFRLIRVTSVFYMMVFTATTGVALLYVLEMLLRTFFDMSFSLIYEGGLFGILFSLFVVTMAAFNLVLDFDLIAHEIESGSPKFLEWYCAFSLLVTLIWLYFEILRLLVMLRDAGRR